MKSIIALLSAGLFGLGSLTACGGGGGNPGDCLGSDEVCGAGRGTTVNTDNTAPQGVPVTGNPPPNQ